MTAMEASRDPVAEHASNGRFALSWGEAGPSLRAAEDGCRQYGCCGGRECGYPLAAARAEISAWLAANGEPEKAEWWESAPDRDILLSAFCYLEAGTGEP